MSITLRAPADRAASIRVRKWGGVLFVWAWAWQRTVPEQGEVHLSICLQRSAGVHRSEKQQDVEEASTPQNGTFRR